MDVPGRPSTAHMAHGVDTPGVGMEDPGTDSKGNHQHKRHRTVRYHVEGGGGADGHLPPRQPTDSQHPPRVQNRKKDRDGYHGV